MTSNGGNQLHRSTATKRRTNQRRESMVTSLDWRDSPNGCTETSASPLLSLQPLLRLSAAYGNPSLTRKRGHLITTLGSRHFSVVGTPLIVSSYGFSARGCGACARAGERASKQASERASSLAEVISGRESPLIFAKSVDILFQRRISPRRDAVRLSTAGGSI